VQVFLLGGSWSNGTGTDRNQLKTAELFSPDTGKWRLLSGIPPTPILTNDPRGVYRSDNHGWFFGWSNAEGVCLYEPLWTASTAALSALSCQACSIVKHEVCQQGMAVSVSSGARPREQGVTGCKNMCPPESKAAEYGTVFHAGPSDAMHWFTTSGDGSVRDAGRRGGGDQMNGNAVMYDAGKILTAGGAPAYDADYAATLEQALATASAFVITLTGTKVAVRRVAPMRYPRAFANSVVLPDGKVVVIGGQPFPVTFTDDNAVLVAGTVRAVLIVELACLIG
jgi:hypothetical protein